MYFKSVHFSKYTKGDLINGMCASSRLAGSFKSLEASVRASHWLTFASLSNCVLCIRVNGEEKALAKRSVCAKLWEYGIQKEYYASKQN